MARSVTEKRQRIKQKGSAFSGGEACRGADEAEDHSTAGNQSTVFAPEETVTQTEYDDRRRAILTT